MAFISRGQRRKMFLVVKVVLFTIYNRSIVDGTGEVFIN